ncbi:MULTISPECIES: LysR family transcriptional regulator [unclassified Undibacterium]|uniref:LysR family transcriptional regulator n=1 Tax=unclassified Undibacterium TaxID=2630295 RepID=UPI002AC983F1|nr:MULTISPECIES: LysR family transcriptional regulator [unclassified Undibacterium]MEB0140628.1 LysR family transcriptional regulator [Undibacterium sp. CCC2.1]MEB0173657.1 LysR family transcriptional regulator [Undibacterium sp. CCC1.1]MEB0177641.1 LysR family transcriptional regulator [Undibacterium sp. CCC3.4]MEB0216842.1 LysR family transcriptional regulator [Undibacterium sp. 5I2]WPX41914.1 LysR family transcriptional regulator [Undibacterium sp. CCC3.4]
MNIRHLSFRLLQVYVQLVRSGTISAAARELHLTQPTVSLQLKKLREAVHDPLFETREGRMVLSHIGAELYSAACDVLIRFGDFNEFLEHARGGSSGHITIGIVTTAKYVMPRILGAFYRHFPQVNVTLHIGNRAHILERFAKQEDDLYVFSHPPSGQSVQAARILKNPLQLIAPLDHWAAQQSALDFSQLRHERFLMREPGSATRMMFEAWLSAQGIELTNTMQIESNEAIRLSTASGLGLSVISAHTLQEGREQVLTLNVKGFPLESNWYLVSRKDRRLSAATMQLIRFMAAHLIDCVQADWVAADIDALAEHFA